MEQFHTLPEELDEEAVLAAMIALGGVKLPYQQLEQQIESPPEVILIETVEERLELMGLIVETDDGPPMGGPPPFKEKKETEHREGCNKIFCNCE